MRSDSNSASGVIRFLASGLRKTPLHPQWFAFFREKKKLKATCANLSGWVLDIGCADAKPRRQLNRDAHYIGVDYYSTATDWYDTRPDVFADAQALPFHSNSIDHCLLLDVLEHIPDPDRCLAAIHDTLKQGGTLTIQVPFLYPVHDAPLDYHRWTRFGLQQAARKHGYAITDEDATGHPLESAALNANIALSKTVLNWVGSRNPLALLGLLLPVAVLAINSLAWIFGCLSKADDLMPYSYRMIWVKE
jgi:SAM-dependent methyltransferase